MSFKNKLEIKQLRKATREQEAHAYAQQCTRRATSRIPRDVAVRVLAEPKNKLTRPKQARMKLALASIVVPPMKEARDIAVKVCVKLRGLSLVGVIRLMKKSARRAATVKNILAKLESNSRFRPSLEAQQTHQLALLKQATAEYQVRTTTNL